MNAIASRTRKSFYRAPVLRTLQRFSQGSLTLILPEGETVVIGDSDRAPQARMRILDDAFFRKCALSGGVGMGESYMDADWETDDIEKVITWFILNIRADARCRGSSQKLPLVGFLKVLDRIGHRLRHNSKDTSRRNIEEHYDLGNDFYQLWLDPTMTYSSARFESPGQSLQEAQVSKYEALCQKLHLQETDHVLEIGCGWGGFSCHAAKRYGCRITGVTISPSQFEEATRRVRAAGLEDRIEIRLQDYRDITGQFDKIASIEMLEAVGHRYHQAWASQCDALLKPEGLLAVQMITVPDADYSELKKGTDFIQKHIFPGSLLLSLQRMSEVFHRSGDLFLHDLEDLGLSYAKTLHAWHERFHAALAGVRNLGFSERFIRKWSYYLKYCQAAFATRNISVVQAVYTRPCNPTLT